MHARVFLRSFGGGEVSPEMAARIDDPRVQNGARKLRNVIVKPQGPATKRPGWEHVARVKAGAVATLIPFRFSATQALMVEVGIVVGSPASGYLRFHSQGRPLLHVDNNLVASVDATADTVTFGAPHGYLEDHQVRVLAMAGGTHPAGLSETTTYFAHVVSPRTIQLAATAGGAAINLTSAGSGEIRVFDAASFPRQHVVSQVASAIDVTVGNESISFASPHGLLTGDRILFVGNTTSDVTVLGLEEFNSYFAIVLDADTIQVASTQANALAGTELNLLAAPGSVADLKMRRAYQVGDIVYHPNATAQEGFYYCFNTPAEGSFGVENNPPSATSHWRAMPDDGTYEIGAPYQAEDLAQIGFDQSFDVLTLVHRNQGTRELRRLGPTTWTLTTTSFGPQLTPPTGLGVSRFFGPQIQIASMTLAAPTVLTTQGPHGLAVAETVYLTGTLGSVTSPDFYQVSTAPSPTTLTLKKISDGSQVSEGFSTTVTTAFLRVTSLSSDNEQRYKITAVTDAGAESQGSAEIVVTNNLDVEGAYTTLTWGAVSGASRYKVYKQQNGLFGFIGETDATSFKDDGIGPDLKATLPLLDLTLSGGVFPEAVGRFDQRRILARDQVVWATKTGSESDLSFSLPTIDSDRIRFQVSAKEWSQIQHIVAMNHLLILASDAIYRVTPVNSDAITPTSIAVRPQAFVGCSSVRPLVVSNTIVFVEIDVGHVREVGFQQGAEGFVPGNLSLRAEHLFEAAVPIGSAQMKAPHPILWFPSSSGLMPAITYVPNEGVGPWHSHDTQGTVEAVGTIPENGEDRLYAVMLRTVGGVAMRSIERMASMVQGALEDSFLVDAGLTYDGRNQTLTTVTISGGRSWGPQDLLTITASTVIFTAGTADIGDQIVLTSSVLGERFRLTIVEVLSGTRALAKLDKVLPSGFRDLPITESWGWARDTLSGLDHLEGKTVQILAEGKVLPPQVVTSGTIQFATPQLIAHVGLGYTAEIHTMPLILPVDGYGKGRTMNVARTLVSVVKSCPFQMGPAGGTLVTVGKVDLAGMQSIDVQEVLPGKWTPGGELVIRQPDPLPLTVVGIALEVAVGN